jgi:small subunit ribosomal protein S6
MPLYEHTFIARPDLSAQQAQTLAEELGAIVTANGGEVKKRSIGACAPWPTG